MAVKPTFDMPTLKQTIADAVPSERQPRKLTPGLDNQVRRQEGSNASVARQVGVSSSTIARRRKT